MARVEKEKVIYIMQLLLGGAKARKKEEKRIRKSRKVPKGKRIPRQDQRRKRAKACIISPIKYLNRWKK